MSSSERSKSAQGTNTMNPEKQIADRTGLSWKLEASLSEKGVGLNELSRAIGPSYEYFRKMVRGMSVPTDPLLRLVAAFFGWDWEETRQLAATDRMRIKYGKMGITAHGLNPEVQKFHMSWEYLTDAQKTFLLSQLQSFLALNIAQGHNSVAASASLRGA